MDIPSAELVEHLIHEKSTLIVPGVHFGMDGHLRISFGSPAAYLANGLEGIGELVV